MSYKITQSDSCYRGKVELDFPANSLVYTSDYMMARINPLPVMQCDTCFFGDISSNGVIVVGNQDNFVLVGAVTAFRSLTMLRAKFEQRRLTAIEFEQPEIKPGTPPEEMVILEGKDWRKLLFDYADLAAEKMGVKPVDSKKNMTGYCTWYYYYKDVTEAHTLENIEALAKNRGTYAAEYVQIDDGYQTFQGDWLEQCDNWPVPLKDVADKIISSGMKAGIWTMPTTASTASRVFREHQDWFVKDARGNVLTLPGWSPEPDNMWACLDATIPEVREHIANIFKTFWNWGFTYFKMDGLYFGLQQGIRHDRNATAVSAFRLLLATIRQAVPEAVIMACSEPMLACLGLVDNARVSGDTSRYFNNQHDDFNCVAPVGCSIAEAFHVSLANFWMIDKWFRCDPDVIMARQDNAFYTRGQAKISVLAGIMTGVCLTSDHLGTINANRLALLGKAQNIRMRNVQPMFTIANIWPMEFEGTIDGKRAVALVNDTNAEKTWYFADLGLAENCYELLDDRKCQYSLTLPAGDAALLIE